MSSDRDRDWQGGFQVSGCETSLIDGSDLRAGYDRGRLPVARAAWNRHRDLLSNTASLLATTGTTSALGFAFWTVAARLFSQQPVGYAAAALSATTLLGTIGVLGLDTLLVGELPQRSNSRAGLVVAALLASGIGSLTLSLAFVIVAPHFSSHFADASGSIDRGAIFCAGVVIKRYDTGVRKGDHRATTRRVATRSKFYVRAHQIMPLVVATTVLHDAVASCGAELAVRTPVAGIR